MPVSPRLQGLCKKHPAGTDIFVPAGNLENILTIFIAAGDFNIEHISRPDNFSELDPAQPRHAQSTCFRLGNKVGNHLQLGYSRQNRVAGEMTGKPR